MALAPARSAGPKFRVWLPAAPLMEKPLAAPSIVQVTWLPEPAGSGSLTVTPFARPVPVLLTVTWKPIWSPALTGLELAVLARSMWAGLQVIEADAESEPSLELVALAVLLYVVHSAAEVVAMTWTVAPAPAVRTAGP